MNEYAIRKKKQGVMRLKNWIIWFQNYNVYVYRRRKIYCCIFRFWNRRSGGLELAVGRIVCSAKLSQLSPEADSCCCYLVKSSQQASETMKGNKL